MQYTFMYTSMQRHAHKIVFVYAVSERKGAERTGVVEGAAFYSVHSMSLLSPQVSAQRQHTPLPTAQASSLCLGLSRGIWNRSPSSVSVQFTDQGRGCQSLYFCSAAYQVCHCNLLRAWQLVMRREDSGALQLGTGLHSTLSVGRFALPGAPNILKSFRRPQQFLAT